MRCRGLWMALWICCGVLGCKQRKAALSSEAQLKKWVKQLESLDFKGKHNKVALGAIASHGKKAFPHLKRTLKSDKLMVRVLSVYALRGMKDGGSTLPLLRKALKDAHFKVRQVAAEGLGKTGSKEAEPALFAALDDPHAKVRREAISALLRLKTTSVGALVKAYQSKHEKVRGFAMRRLGHCPPSKDKKVLAAIAAGLKDPSTHVRAWARSAAPNHQVPVPPAPGPRK